MIDLHSRVMGKGTPLVLLHGLFGSMENLGGIARLLADDFELHMLDLRNHGRSPHHEEMSYPLMAEDVYRYLVQAGLESVLVLGHSMGGKVAMQLSLHHSETVKALVVADIAPVQYPPHHDDIFEGLQSVHLERLQSRQEADQVLQAFVPEKPVRQFLLKNLTRRPEGGYQWRINLPVLIEQYENIAAGQRSDTPYPGAVLFIAGGDSSYIRPDHREDTAKLFPNAELKVIPGTGHWLHAEKPELFVRTVKRFLAKQIL